MSNTKSHPEKWEHEYNSNAMKQWIYKDGRLVCSVNKLEDAERITACVNACAGITTGALELVAQESGNILAGMHRIEKENAALRAALEQERELRRIAEFENESNIQDK
jgi:hypothetical protein